MNLFDLMSRMTLFPWLVILLLAAMNVLTLTVAAIALSSLACGAALAAGEKSATFTIEQTETVAPVFPTKAFARYVLRATHA